MFVPLANLIWIIIFAFSYWPIQRELDAYRATNTATRWISRWPAAAAAMIAGRYN
jgi:hypothetical protein